jgi:hypothetical protein
MVLAKYWASKLEFDWAAYRVVVTDGKAVIGQAVAPIVHHGHAMARATNATIWHICESRCSGACFDRFQGDKFNRDLPFRDLAAARFQGIGSVAFRPVRLFYRHGDWFRLPAAAEVVTPVNSIRTGR